MRLFLALFTLTFAQIASAQPATAPTDRPNVLLIVGDDLTYTDFGFAGHPDVQTPNLDRLRSEGMYLRRTFTTAPMCAPTRMSIYTGLYPVRSGGHPNHSRVYDGVKSLPHYLAPLGYRVALLGKRHYAPREAFPFEYLGGRHHDGGRRIDLDFDVMREFLQETDDPFCLVIASNQPHAPWNRGDASAYDAEVLTLPPYFVDTPETRRALTRYYAEITYLDDQVGQALRALETAGHADDTIVIFVSEQGSQLPHGKWTLYDTGMRAAGLVRYPGVTEPGSASDALVSYVDILPTIVDAVNGKPGELDVDGRSFLPVLRGETDEHHEAVFGVQTSRGIHHGPESYGIRAVRTDRFKYIRNLSPEVRFQNMITEGSGVFESWRKAAEQGNEFAAERVAAYQHRPAEELYDLQADPLELNNLADDPAYADELAALRARLDAWMDSQGDEGQATEMEALERQPDDAEDN